MAERTTIRAELNTSLAEETLLEIADRLEDRPRIMGKVSTFAERWQDDVFRTRGGVAGKRWEPLKPSTIAEKGGRRPMIRTGVLKRALSAEPRVLSASVQLRGPEYAKYLRAGRHYDGTGRGGNMPKRNPTPQPPRGVLSELMSDLLGLVTDGTS